MPVNFLSVFYYRTFKYITLIKHTELKQKLIRSFGNDVYLKLKIQEEANGHLFFSVSKFMPFSLYPTARLQGRYVAEAGQNIVTIKVRPSLAHLLFLIGVIAFIVREFYFLFSGSQDLATTIFISVLCIVAFAIDYILALGFSNNLKDNFEDSIAVDASATTATKTSVMP